MDNLEPSINLFSNSVSTLIFNLFSSFLVSEPVLFSTLYTLTFTLSKPVGGILFGIAFWYLARKLGDKNVIRNYMIVSAYGLVLVFVSNQASVLVSASYPPFGIVSASFMGLASYLVVVGIYSTAISVAEDSSLRRSIRSFAIKESKLLESIGTAQMEQHIKKKVIEFTKRNQEKIAEETGIQSSLTEEDMRQYLEEVISEVKMQRTGNKTSETNNGNI